MLMTSKQINQTLYRQGRLDQQLALSIFRILEYQSFVEVILAAMWKLFLKMKISFIYRQRKPKNLLDL